MERLRGEARLCKWVASSIRPELHRQLCEEPSRRWPEAAAFHYMWTPVEDFVLEEWVSFTQATFAVRHLSLHFDGIRVDKFSINDKEKFCRDSADHIFAKTGYRVHIVEKVHRTFFEAMQSGVSTESSSSPPPEVSGEGDCIPCALWHLIPDARDDIIAQCKSKTAANTLAGLRGSRAYKDWNSVHGWTLVPRIGLHIDRDASFLIHAGGRGPYYAWGVCGGAGGVTHMDRGHAHNIAYHPSMPTHGNADLSHIAT